MKALIATLSILTLNLLVLPLMADPLPSWNNTAAKKEIKAFVDGATNPDSTDYIPPSDRVAVFDNDGTLWSEQPLYFQLFFIFDRVKELALQHPEWAEKEPFASVLKGNYEQAMASGTPALVEMAAATQTGITNEEFNEAVSKWLETAKHPTKNVLYTDLVFQPMLELLTYLRANDFKTYIVSGGGVDFIRVFAEKSYGIPPSQVIGSTMDSKFEMRDGIPTIVKTDKIILVDDKEGKPVGIYQYIGQRPVFAAGNSDGDMQMLEYTTIPRSQSDTKAHFGLIVHHDDGEREWAYDRESHIGRLDKAWDAATKEGWLVVSMKDDWATIYPSK
ncbi:HAD family hydrolase [Cerasicoccus frondis]|uniref:HAD family hydrolase n=1 Tax=Cerasicoccus frondis TaxID=490090 RepID=UPI00285293D4|nr:HAD family hydrolase [Cerasicoccus frondis]